MRRKIFLILFGLLTSLLLLSCSNDESSAKNQSAPQAKPQPPAVQTLSRVPENAAARFAAVQTTDVDGKVHSLSEWLGKKPVVVNFWGTWCPPCRREIPDLVRLYDEYRGRGVEIVSLAIERTAGPSEVRDFSRQAGMNWVMLMSNDATAQVFRLGGSVPTTIFYDAAGKETARFVGARSYQDFKPDFEKIAGS